jgi:ParB-like chromosome segregation protein Spo0J
MGQKANTGLLRSRIVGEGDEAPDQLMANPLNWRKHPAQQVDALEGLLKQVGWVQRVIVNKRTGHVVDGHARVELAIRRNEVSVPVVYVDLSEAEERLVLSALDPIGGLAITDADKLGELLRDVSAEDAGLQALLADLGKTIGIDLDDPHDIDEVDEIKEECTIIIVCENWNQREEAIDRLGGKKVDWIDIVGKLR